MSTSKISKKRKNELKKLSEAPDKKIDYSDIPELDEKFWEEAVVEFPKVKKMVSIRLDTDVIIWFKSRFKEYQTAMNAVLKAYMNAHK